MNRLELQIRMTVFAMLLGLAAAAAASPVPPGVWPETADRAIGTLGRAVGIVFTPDLSVTGNCRFYETLGFACFQSADWSVVLDDIRRHNRENPDARIRTLVLETHGTNGHGLKLQESKRPGAPRSYISVGGLQERLDEAGVERVILSACNSGRLLRPAIYRKLNRNPGDKLFLPPTRGVIDASESFDPETSRVQILAPSTSHIETTIVASPSELGPAARHSLRQVAEERGIVLPPTFAISDMLMQLLVGDSSLNLQPALAVETLSSSASTPEESERLFEALINHLDEVALRAAGTVESGLSSPPRPDVHVRPLVCGNHRTEARSRCLHVRPAGGRGRPPAAD